MKQEAVGTITKSGGFSRIVREVHDSGEPIQIIRNNEVVAMVMPANSDVVNLVDMSMNFGKTLKSFHDKGMNFDLQKYLLSQILTGIQAQALLLATTGVDIEMIKKGEQGMIAAINEIVKNELIRRESIRQQSEDITPG